MSMSRQYGGRKRAKVAHTNIHVSISNDVKEFNCIQNIHTRCVICDVRASTSTLLLLLLFISEKLSASSYMMVVNGSGEKVESIHIM